MKSTSRFNSNHKGIECLNCKQPIHNMDNFCSNCGQVNDTKSVSIKQFITELLGGFFAFDTRSIKTLFLLLIKPGKVSDEYINGKRMKYVNPFQLYLHTSIIFFLVTGIFSSIDEYNNLGANISNNKEVNQKKKDSLVNALTSLEINTDNDGFSINFGSKKKKDSIVTITNSQDVKHQMKKEYKGLLQNKDFLQNKKLLIILENANLSSQEKNTQIKKIIESEIGESYGKSILKGNKINYQEFEEIYLTSFQEELSKNKFDLVIDKSLYTENNDAVKINNFSFKKYNRFINSRTKNVEKGLDSLGYKKTRKNIFWYKKLQGLNDVLKSREALNDYKKKSISNLSIVLFFILPIFTLFVSLIYIRDKHNYTENLIFVFNVQTVFFIFLLLAIIFDRVFKTDIGVNLTFPLGFLFYLYKAMRNFYKQRRAKTIIKFLFLNFVFMILSVFGVFAIVSLAFLF